MEGGDLSRDPERVVGGDRMDIVEDEDDDDELDSAGMIGLDD